MDRPAPTTSARVPRRVVARWIVPVYSLLAVALVPWVVWLAWTLPAHSVSAHYRLGWVGFDVLLCGALARTAWLAWRRSPFVVNVASATAALLVVDAWFDVTTSPGGQDLIVSTITAIGIELPLAVFSLVLAARAQLQIARTGAVASRPLLQRWMSPGPVGAAAGGGVVKPVAPNAPTDPAAPAPDLAAWPLAAGRPLSAPKAGGAAVGVNPPPTAAVPPSV